MKKKILSLMMAMVMILSLSVTALASEVVQTTATTKTLSKTYTITNSDVSVSPEETLEFTVAKYSFNGSKASEDIAGMPTVTIDDLTFLASDATGYEDTQDIQIKLPSFTNVGVYVYKITENVGNTLGVEYYGEEMYLEIHVVNEVDDTTNEYTGNLVIESTKIHVYSTKIDEVTNEEVTVDNKIDEIENVYNAGSLTVSKTVTGSTGEKDREYEVTVTFTNSTTKTVESTITYGTNEISPKDWIDGKAEVTIKLTDGDEVVFNNIPYGVTYSVEETDTTISGDGYDDPTYSLNGDIASDSKVTSEEMDTDKETVEITNNRDTKPDTGISLDSLPYILMLIVVAAGVVVMISRRRLNDRF